MKVLTTERLACIMTLAISASSVTMAAQAEAPSTPTQGLTRQQVAAELLSTEATHRWDETSAQWVPREPVAPVGYGLTRDEVRAETAAFFRANRWDESQGGWALRTPLPREPAALTRAQVAESRDLFLESHSWEEATQLWLEHVRAPRTR